MLEFAPIAHVIYCRMGIADFRKASIFGGDSYLALGVFLAPSLFVVAAIPSLVLSESAED